MNENMKLLAHIENIIKNSNKNEIDEIIDILSTGADELHENDLTITNGTEIMLTLQKIIENMIK